MKLNGIIKIQKEGQIIDMTKGMVENSKGNDKNEMH